MRRSTSAEYNLGCGGGMITFAVSCLLVILWIANLGIDGHNNTNLSDTTQPQEFSTIVRQYPLIDRPVSYNSPRGYSVIGRVEVTDCDTPRGSDPVCPNGTFHWTLYYNEPGTNTSKTVDKYVTDLKFHTEEDNGTLEIKDSTGQIMFTISGETQHSNYPIYTFHQYDGGTFHFF